MSRLTAIVFAGCAALAIAACGERQPEPDAAALDQYFNNVIAAEEAHKEELIQNARAREEVREREMEENAQNYAEMPD